MVDSTDIKLLSDRKVSTSLLSIFLLTSLLLHSFTHSFVHSFIFYFIASQGQFAGEYQSTDHTLSSTVLGSESIGPPESTVLIWECTAGEEIRLVGQAEPRWWGITVLQSDGSLLNFQGIRSEL